MNNIMKIEFSGGEPVQAAALIHEIRALIDNLDMEHRTSPALLQFLSDYTSEPHDQSVATLRGVDVVLTIKEET